MNILGISAWYHDSAAALVQDGRIAAAAQEERFTRIRHDAAFPSRAAAWCLRRAGVQVRGLDAVVFYDKPLVKFGRLLETYLSFAPRGLVQYMQVMPSWLKQKINLPREIRRHLEGYQGPIFFGDHHESHAASAFFPSPFREAALLCVDGVGEWSTTSWGVGSDARIELRARLDYPHSLGLLYSAFTWYTGFKINSGEYKVMGLAPYGEPRYVQTILEHLIDLRDDGSFRLNPDYFNYMAGTTMTSGRFHHLFGGPPRKPESRLTQRDMDLARSVQDVCELVMLRLARHVRKETGLRNLCLAGGVALNCVANGKIHREGIFDGMWIQPAAGDSGGALGCALYLWHQYLENRRDPIPSDSQQGSLLGPEYSSQEIDEALAAFGARSEALEQDELIRRTAQLLAQGKVAGWFQGRMEFGPRALGARSILGDPRDRQMQSRMNLAIKFRESFRPFAPAVLREYVNEYFEFDDDSPYMLQVAPVRENLRIAMTEEQQALFGVDKLNVPRSIIPAVTHVDYSARLQTVDEARNPIFHRLLREFHAQTGCPVLINTSFNVRGEPIVNTPQEAYVCFMRTNMDVLAIGGRLLLKDQQPPFRDDGAWKTRFELD
ncbi:MAG: Decarbamoylnovobiocin carbamoyltransferase [Myxococcota bacterium]|nr:Decarbamoylnovobiocin carbamoyltransferase [Myxococcota bacterium]